MRGRWLKIDKKASQPAIAIGACDPRTISMEITLWLLLAGITMALSGCGGSLHRAYHYEGDRYHETQSGGDRFIGPGGQLANATSVVSVDRSPSINSSKDVSLVENEGGKPDPPSIAPMVETTASKSDVADRDMAGYEIVPETGGCKPFALSITAAAFRTPYEKRHSCWNLLWDIPAGVLLDAFVASLIILKVYGGLLGG